MQGITQSSFLLAPKNSDAYELQLSFLDQQGGPISQKSFIFSQQCPPQEGEIVDVYSQNGSCSEPLLKQLFNKSDVAGVNKATRKLKALGPVVLVLDLKDENKGYLDEGAIAKSEAVVCDFFQQKAADGAPKHAKKIHKLFQKTLDFVICEGSLKTDLLKQFAEPEVEYFQNTQQGAIHFCQCAEFFMNGFKLGQEVRGIASEKYITPISGHSFEPHQKSTVLYPALYKDIYSVHGKFAQVLKPVFSVNGRFDEESQITEMSVEMKT